MAITVVASSSGTTTAALPAGTTSGDMVVVFAYAAASATAPTLPTSWTDKGSRAVSPAVRVALRVYDGVWTMPTFTGATACHAVTLRGAVTTAGAASVFAGATATTISWAAYTTTAGSITLRGGVHARADQVPTTPAGHTLVASSGASGTAGYVTAWTLTQSPGAVTSTTARSDLTSSGQVEIRAATVTERPREHRRVLQAVNRAGTF